MADVRNTWKKLDWRLRAALVTAFLPLLLLVGGDLAGAGSAALRTRALAGAAPVNRPAPGANRPAPGAPTGDRGQNGTTAALNDAVSINLADNGTVGVTITGTWTATHTFEGSANGIDWFTVNAYAPTALLAVTTTTSNGNWIVPVAGFTSFRVRRSLTTSGTANVFLRAGPYAFFAPGSGGGGGGTVRISADGTNFNDSVSFIDVNATVSPTTTAQLRSATDLLVQDPTGNVTNRVRAARSLITGTPNGGALLGVGLGTYDGTGFQAARQAGTADATNGTGLLGTGGLIYDGANWRALRDRQATADAQTGGITTVSVAANMWAFNNATMDRVRTVNGLDGGAGTTGMLGAGVMLKGATQLQMANAAATVDADTGGRIAPVANSLYNGTTYDRQRTAQSADNSTLGVIGVCPMLKSTSVTLQQENANTATDTSNGSRMPTSAPFGWTGGGWDKTRNANVYKVVALGSGTAETTIWTPAGGKKFRLMGFVLTCGAASTLTFKDNTAGTTIFAARGGVDVPIEFQPSQTNGILSAAANNVLTVTRGTACTLDGTVWGTEEALGLFIPRQLAALYYLIALGLMWRDRRRRRWPER